MEHMDHNQQNPSNYEYGKFAIVIFFILLLTGLNFSIGNSDSIGELARYFMGSFFLVFSFFKLLNLKGFAHGYMSYDVLAKRSKTYASLYPFVELFLGIVFPLNLFMPYAAVFTIILMSISLVGVFQSMGRGIKCACLGEVINLPLSEITLTEDLSMLAMAVIMLIL